MLDYRVVALGAVLPLLEAGVGRPSILHTLLGAAGMLALVVLGTQKRRLVRRRLLGLPIGALMHLVLDGSWTRASLFWWPVFGSSFGDRQIPEFSRSWQIYVVLELTGVACGWWACRRFELNRPENRLLLLRTGQLSRSVLS